MSEHDELGSALPPVTRTFTLKAIRQWQRPDAPTQNLHVDAAAARAEGLPAPIAQGPNVIALVSRMMMHEFGEGWIQGGKIAVNLTRPVFAGDTITARGAIVGLESEPPHVRVLCDVWAENQDGTRVLVGTASALRRAQA